MNIRLRCCFIGLLFLLQFHLSAQEKSEFYFNHNIPDSILKGADAVCRLDEHEIEIISPGKITVRERHIYTILNDNAEKLATYKTHYDKLDKIDYVEAAIYNSQGKEFKHFKAKDMSDYEDDGDAMVSDSRMKAGKFVSNSYPYTVVFDEQDDEAGTFYIPDWTPPRSEKMSLETSRYVLTYPVDYKVRLKMINTDVKPVITQKGNRVTYVWEIHNLPVIPDEPFAISSLFYDPVILIGATEFKMEGYEGNLTSWDEYGKFYYSLFKQRDTLPPELKKEVHMLTDHVNDPYKKIAALYDYLQKNTHYVLISFGIGGFQPYDANYVAKNKYGDCKALSNFMVALLKEAGIKGYPVIIRGGEDETEFVKDFPSHQANHVICAVPVGQDTVWLECTSQILPPGYLGSFTANRYGLLINEHGGTLVHTPAYLLKDNTSVRKISATVDADGNMRVNSETNYKALSHDRYQEINQELSKEQQLEYLAKEFNLPTYTVNSLSYNENHTDRLPVIHESLDMSVNSYAHVSGKRIFINPNILQRSQIKLSDEKDRKLDFQFKKEFNEVDSVEIAIPGGYTVESQPKDIFLQSKFGNYTTRIDIRNNKIYYYRKLDHFSGCFPATAFQEIRTYYDNIYDADNSQIVFVKN